MIGFIQSFLDLRGIIKSEKTTLREPHHLLDLLRIMIVVEDCNKEGDHTLIGGMPSNDQSSKGKKNIKKKLQTHRNIQELLTAGFKIKENVNQSLTNIHVDGLKLYLSRLTMDDFTAQTFLNMIAYEMCPDFKNHYEISNYVWFLNSLIDHADDVKELRKARVLNNLLGSDEEVAKIFNTVSTDLVIYTGKYKNVTDEIEQLYKKKVSIWLTELRLKHFNTPWKIIGLISAVLGVFLTIVTLMRELRGKIKMD
ncbi:uncharacterized protein LOC129313970 [Prosopis cineraria]|uniref:uncharacterized protein LOC129313970 n=1 Tax=Prosopis cineraria TaxID=364024 RepID=UPI002410B3DB|nr:uncharacterized protein LOC129313970 [Prosopis cineraria]